MRGTRALVAVGVLLMLVGALDPLEGSLLILTGSGLAAVGARLAHGRRGTLLAWAFALVLAGVVALVTLSALGGFGGDSGRSAWWALLLLPYLVGWLLGIAGAIMWLMDHRGAEPRHGTPT